ASHAFTKPLENTAHVADLAADSHGDSFTGLWGCTRRKRQGCIVGYLFESASNTVTAASQVETTACWWWRGWRWRWGRRDRSGASRGGARWTPADPGNSNRRPSGNSARSGLLATPDHSMHRHTRGGCKGFRRRSRRFATCEL